MDYQMPAFSPRGDEMTYFSSHINYGALDLLYSRELLLQHEVVRYSRTFYYAGAHFSAAICEYRLRQRRDDIL